MKDHANRIRWEIEGRIIADDTMPDAVRIAAALVVLYGQPLVRIVSLRRDDVIYEGTSVTIGVGNGNRLPLLAPFDGLICRLPSRRTAGPSDLIPSA